jgi:hypothetical protein
LWVCSFGCLRFVFIRKGEANLWSDSDFKECQVWRYGRGDWGRKKVMRENDIRLKSDANMYACFFLRLLFSPTLSMQDRPALSSFSSSGHNNTNRKS